MSTLFEDLQERLLQAIDYANGEGPAHTIAYKLEPVTLFIKSGFRETCRAGSRRKIIPEIKTPGVGGKK